MDTMPSVVDRFAPLRNATALALLDGSGATPAAPRSRRPPSEAMSCQSRSWTTTPRRESTKSCRATLGLLKRTTLDHGNLEPEDVRPVIRAGVSKEAIQDALEVAFLFNVYLLPCSVAKMFKRISPRYSSCVA